MCVKLAGTNSEGKPKVRPIDDMTRQAQVVCIRLIIISIVSPGRSGCNAATSPCEKFKYESLDKLLSTIRRQGQTASKSLELWKADIDAAFRYGV